jgi:hypothetical protein
MAAARRAIERITHAKTMCPHTDHIDPRLDLRLHPRACGCGRISRSEFANPRTSRSGAAACGKAFRRAMALANSGEKSGLTSFTCNQHKRSFSFSFNGKSLSKPAPVA